jgi:hypothetical protein
MDVADHRSQCKILSACRRPNGILRTWIYSSLEWRDGIDGDDTDNVVESSARQHRGPRRLEIYKGLQSQRGVVSSYLPQAEQPENILATLPGVCS